MSETGGYGSPVGVRRKPIGTPTGNPNCNRVVLYMHPKGTKGPGLMKNLLATIGWSIDDLENLGIITKRKKPNGTA